VGLSGHQAGVLGPVGSTRRETDTSNQTQVIMASHTFSDSRKGGQRGGTCEQSNLWNRSPQHQHIHGEAMERDSTSKGHRGIECSTPTAKPRTGRGQKVRLKRTCTAAAPFARRGVVGWLSAAPPLTAESRGRNFLTVMSWWPTYTVPSEVTCRG
jgi:hypothetical protein